MSNITKEQVFDSLRRWTFDDAFTLHSSATRLDKTSSYMVRYYQIDGENLTEKEWAEYIYEITGWTPEQLTDEFKRRVNERLKDLRSERRLKRVNLA